MSSWGPTKSGLLSREERPSCHGSAALVVPSGIKMSWISSILPGPLDHRDNARMEARQRAATRAKLVANLRDAVQGLAGLHSRTLELQSTLEAKSNSSAQPLLNGESPEAKAVYCALEQCLLHRIRTKDFGVIPLWAFIERVERLPMMTQKGARPGPRERRLSSVRNTAGAVSSFRKISTPLGRARAWIRQCILCKCLETCVTAILGEIRLVQLFYEDSALVRCQEGSAIVLRLCSALEAFDIGVDAEHPGLDARPAWNILDEEERWDRRMEATMTSNAGHGGSHGGARAPSSSSSSSTPSMGREWFEHQKAEHQRRAAAADKGDGWAQLDNVLATVTSTVDQAVHKLDEKIADMFGGHGQDDAFGIPSTPATASPSVSSDHVYPRPAWSAQDSQRGSGGDAGGGRVVGDGWVEIRGDSLHLHGREGSSAMGSEHGWGAGGSGGGGGGAPGHPPGSSSPGAAFARGDSGLVRASGKRGKPRVFGVALEELVTNPDRCSRGLLEPALGVPDAVQNLIEALSDPSVYKTPRIFLEEGSESELFRVVKSLEKSNQVPSGSLAGPAWLVSRLPTGEADGAGDKTGGGGKAKGSGMSPHALAAALLFFLHRLPEPLLTFRRREAFLACEVIPNVEDRVRNIKLLVDDLPWAHKPLLLALVDLFVLIKPPQGEDGVPSLNGGKMGVSPLGVTIIDENDFFSTGGLEGVKGGGDSGSGETKGVSFRDAAESLAPAVLRPPSSESAASKADGASNGPDGGDGELVGKRVTWEEELAATSIMELLLFEEKRVLTGVRAELARREQKLDGKVKRLSQLQRMLAAKVYLGRYAHLAVAISIWRRLAGADQDLLSSVEGDEVEAVLGPIAPAFADADGASRGGVSARGTTGTVSHAPGVSGEGAAGVGSKETPATAADVEQDLRELESMFMGVEEGTSGSWVGDVSIDGESGDLAPSTDRGGSVAPRAIADDIKENTPVVAEFCIGDSDAGEVLGDSVTEAVALSGSGDGGGLPPSSSATGASTGDGVTGSDQVAFTIDEDYEEKVASRGDPGSHANEEKPGTAVRETLPHHASSGSISSVASADYENTKKLLGSIAASLTPDDPELEDVYRPLSMTKSELALVKLMGEGGEESGKLPAATLASHGRRHGGSNGGRSGGEESSSLSGFDESLRSLSTATGSVSSVGNVDGGVATPSGDRGHAKSLQLRRAGSSRDKSTSAERGGNARTGSASPRQGVDEVADHAGTLGADAQAGNAPPASLKPGGRSEPSRDPKFTLGDRRWIRCGFAPGMVLDKGGHASAVGRALRSAGSVLALDSVNYFLWRYPWSARRAVASFAKRHKHAPSSAAGPSGTSGSDVSTFPTLAAHLTRVISDLLSLPPPPQTAVASPSANRGATSPRAGAHGSSQWKGSGGVADAGGAGGKDDGSEPGDACALRLSREPAWKFLDSPHAFQEAFCCAVLVMEAFMGERSWGHQPLRYQDALLETRRVLRACLLHTPHSVDAFWAAATVEGGVSPDSRDMDLASPGSEDVGDTRVVVARDGAGKGDSSMGAELVKTFGLSELDVRDSELEECRGRTQRGTAEGARGQAPSIPAAGHVAEDTPSSDDRLTFGENPSDSASTSNDWLLAGETGRVGMTHSIEQENSGKKGPEVSQEGPFRTHLLRPSQILSAENVRALAEQLPESVTSCDWVNVFSDARHGTSLKTLLSRCTDWEPTLIVFEAAASTVGIHVGGGGPEIKGIHAEKPPVHADGVETPGRDEGGDEDAGLEDRGREVHSTGRESPRDSRVVFGGFASGSSWLNMGRGYRGDGGSFIFAFEAPVGRRSDAEDEGEAEYTASEPLEDAALVVYRWSGSDRYFMTSDEEFGIGMGGGGKKGEFGFFLGKDLRRGSTGRCGTFDNDPLVRREDETLANASLGSTFEVRAIEVWGFRSVVQDQSSWVRTAL